MLNKSNQVRACGAGLSYLAPLIETFGAQVQPLTSMDKTKYKDFKGYLSVVEEFDKRQKEKI
ncbi:MAG: hypothetical protein O7I42_22085 [Alphaproteobacteria bacterium]|nr:hypothetical protein [Alphaproteobacteria bacterium]